ncbi:MAG: BACON domain-containing carbohydrate-binding protein [Bacteroidota bacterium]|nr:BACON domain-containing carbohydrate-binding protein [Bacteroidota bacterium]
MKRLTLFCLSSILFLQLIKAQNTVIKFEYWFDYVYGNRITQTLSPQPTQNIVQNLNVASIGLGFHYLNMRFQSSDSVWSCVQSNLIHKVKLPFLPLLAAYEYWFDNNYATKTRLTLNGTQEQSLIQSLNTDSLTPGFHYLNMRFQSTDSVWSGVQSNLFNKIKPSIIAQLTAYEYWFDDKYASKVRLALNGTQEQTLIQSLNVDSLTPGFHYLNMRFQSADSVWSNVQSKLFNKLKPPLIPQLTKYEYWFDTAYNNHVSLNIIPSVQILNLDTIFSIINLKKGYHVLHTRYATINDIWSSVSTDTFYSKSLLLIDSILGSLCANDSLKIRFKKTATYITGNIFSIQLSDSSGSFSTPLNIGNKAGTTNGTDSIMCFLPASLANSNQYKLRILCSNISDTSNESYAFAINNAPFVSAILPTGPITFCAGDSVNLYINAQGGYRYRWMLNGNNTVNNADTLASLKVKTSGTYNVKVTNSTGCTSLMYDKQVSVIAKPATTAISGNTNVLVGSTQNYSVTNTNGSVYNWSIFNGTQTGGGTTNAITVLWPSTPGSGLIKVVETNSTGCNGDTITLLVNLGSYTLNVTPLYLSYSNTASTKKVTVSSNTSWSVNASHTWITLNKTSGNGNDSMNITVTANTGETSRTGTVTFQAGSQSQIVNIKQDSTPAIPDQLSLGKDTLNFLFNGGTQNVNVSSNKSWTVNHSASWLNINPMSGSNNGVLGVTAQVNGTSNQRSVTVFVTAGALTRNLVVVQQKTTGTEEINLSDKVKVYPNPTDGTLYINNESEENIQIKMIDLSGKLIDEFILNFKTLQQMNYEYLSDGIYLIQLISPDKVMQRKIVITK